MRQADRLVASTAVLAAVLLAPRLAIAGEQPQRAGAPAAAGLTHAVSRATLPARLVVRLRRLERLYPNTVELTERAVDEEALASGVVRRRRSSVSMATTRSPALARIVEHRPGRPALEWRFVGGTLYARGRRLERLDPTRPWLAMSPRKSATPEVLKLLVDLPRIDLEHLPGEIRKATSAQEVGARRVDGKQTIEFALTRHDSHESARLRIFLARDGLPVELEESGHGSSGAASVVRLAYRYAVTEAPISVAAPPASATMTEVERSMLEKRERRRQRRAGGGGTSGGSRAGPLAALPMPAAVPPGSSESKQ